MKNISQHVEDFKKYMVDQRSINTSTLRNYVSYLDRFISTVSTSLLTKEVENDVRTFEIKNGELEIGLIVTLDHITVEAIENFKSVLTAEGVGKKTINYYLIGIRVFLKWLTASGVEVLNPTKVELYKKVKDKKIDLISREELQKFLTHNLDVESDLVANMLFSTGMRIFELEQLNIEDIRTCSFAIRGKGGKDRVVFLAPEVCKMLTDYIGERKIGPIFLNRWGNRMSKRYLQKIIENRADMLSVSKKVSAHTLRHLFATDLLENGADLRSIQEMLGHSSILTTQKYTHISNAHLENSFNKFHSNFSVKSRNKK